MLRSTFWQNSAELFFEKNRHFSADFLAKIFISKIMASVPDFFAAVGKFSRTNKPIKKLIFRKRGGEPGALF
jgi:hypothetical protein